MVILTVKEVVVIIIAMIIITILVIIIRHTVEKVAPSNQDSFAGNWKILGSMRADFYNYPRFRKNHIFLLLNNASF